LLSEQIDLLCSYSLLKDHDGIVQDLMMVPGGFNDTVILGRKNRWRFKAIFTRIKRLYTILGIMRLKGYRVF